jgi:hypothetical protein
MENKIYFCKRRCCPFIEINLEEEKVKLGDSDGPEGVTEWTINQYNDFIEAVLDGRIEKIKK